MVRSSLPTLNLPHFHSWRPYAGPLTANNPWCIVSDFYLHLATRTQPISSRRPQPQLSLPAQPRPRVILTKAGFLRVPDTGAINILSSRFSDQQCHPAANVPDRAYAPWLSESVLYFCRPRYADLPYAESISHHPQRAPLVAFSGGPSCCKPCSQEARRSHPPSTKLLSPLP